MSGGEVAGGDVAGGEVAGGAVVADPPPVVGVVDPVVGLVVVVVFFFELELDVLVTFSLPSFSVLDLPILSHFGNGSASRPSWYFLLNALQIWAGGGIL